MPTTVAIQPDGAGTWRTGVVFGATDGILPETISPITLQGDKIPIESIGISDVEFMKILAVNANPTLTFIMRWSGMFWAFLAHWMGDDTMVFAASIATHDMNYQTRSTLNAITMGARIDDNNSKILEWPSLKPQQIIMAPNTDGFWEMQIVCMGNTIEANADAANGSVEFDAVTYITKARELCVRANLFRINTGAGGLASPTDDRNVQDLTITLERPLVNDRPTEGTVAKGGAQVQIPEPVQDGPTIVTVGFNEPDFIDFASLVDEFKDDTEFKADLKYAETVNSLAYQSLMEFALMEYMPPEANIDRQARVPLQREFRCITAQATPTGMQTANPIHVELKNEDNLTYETGV